MQQTKRFAFAMLPAAVLSLAACGMEAGANGLDAAQEAQQSALLPSRVIDLDALFDAPATQSYTAAAQEPGSPCGPMLKDAVTLGGELGPAIAAKNYGVIATHLPEILATMKELFACVKVVKASQGAGGSLPAAPAVPQHNPRVTPCVTVIWHGDSGSTCP